MTFAELMLSETGYETKTTFWDDFSIAERFGIYAIEDTFNRAFNEWKNDIEYLSELALVLNHKVWQHYKNKPLLARTYDAIWAKCDSWCAENLDNEQLSYYYSVND